MNNATPAPHTILFDVGNTLTWVDVERGVRLLADAGHGRTLVAVTDAERRARRVMYRLPEGYADADRWHVFVTTLLQELGLGDDEAQLDDLRERVFAVHRAEHLWRRVEPSTPRVLATLRERGYRLGVISNSDGRVPELLRDVALADFFEVILDSQIEGVEKPDPRIFARALERMGVAAAEAAYVGDFRDVDVVGARRAGLRPVLLDPLGLESDADFPVLASLEDVLELFPART